VIQITPQMRVLVAIEPVDFRRGIDGLSQVCRAVLSADPLSGTVFVFRSRSGKAIKLLVYDGQGFWPAFVSRANQLLPASASTVMQIRALGELSGLGKQKT
jgi:transposase